MFRRFCKRFSESSTSRWAALQLPKQAGGTGELPENLLQNPHDQLPPQTVRLTFLMMVLMLKFKIEMFADRDTRALEVQVQLPRDCGGRRTCSGPRCRREQVADFEKGTCIYVSRSQNCNYVTFSMVPKIISSV